MASFPPRQSGSIPFPASRGPVGGTVDAVRARVLARMPEKLDPVRLKRMPESLMRKEVRRLVELMVDAEGPRLGRIERDLLVDDLVGDALGFGPLEELLRDPAMREVLVLNWQTVLARRDEQGWVPTNVKFRDVEHLRQTLEKAMSHAEPIGTERLPASAIDAKLSNGFRVIAVIPPLVLEQSPIVTFIRSEANATPPPTNASGMIGMALLTRPAPNGSSGLVATPPPRAAAPAPVLDDVLVRLQARITERILSKLAALGVSDIYRVEARELHKVITAYIAEYSTEEKVRLNEASQIRMAQEIMTALRP